MGKTAITKLLAVAAVALSFVSCEDKPFEDLRSEYYARNFIKEFGLIDPEQDWNMAKEGAVTLIVGDERADVQIYGLYGSHYYMVADLKGMKGRFDVPFDVPKDCDEVMVKVNGAKYYGRIGDTIDCSDHPASRGISTDGTASGTGSYTVTVSQTSRGNRVDHPAIEEINAAAVTGVGSTINYTESDDDKYQYFNVQQIGPIVTTRALPNDGDYYSLNGNVWRQFTNNKGVLPENGVENQTRENEPTGEGTSSFDKDFVYELGSAGMLTVYPYYYNSPKIHRLGIYLVDDNGNPLDKDGKPVTITQASDLNLIAKYPIFLDKQNGDLQIAPKRPAGLSANAGSIEFVAKDNTKYPATLSEGDGHTYLTIMKGATIDLNDFVQLKVNGTVVDLNEYTSRFSFHAFNSGDIYEVDRDGILKAHNTLSGSDTGADKVNVGIDNATDGYNDLSHNKNNNDTNDSYGMRKLTIRIQNNNPNTNWQREPSPIRTIEVAGLTGTDNNEVEVWQGETKRLKITIKDKNDNVLDFDTYSYYLETLNWVQGTMFDFNLDKENQEIVITGIGSVKDDEDNTYHWDQWAHLFADDDGDGVVDNDNNDPYLDTEEADRPIHVIVKENKTHTYTTTINGFTWPVENPAWSDFFYSAPDPNTDEPKTLSDDQRTGTYSKPRRASSVETVLWTGEHIIQNWGDNNFNVCKDADYWEDKNLNSITAIKIYCSGDVEGGEGYHQIIASYPYGDWSDKLLASTTPSNDPITITLNAESRSKIAQYGFVLQGYYVKITKVSIIKEQLEDGDWLTDGQQNAVNALKTYYAAQPISGACQTHDDITLTSGAAGVTTTVDVVIPDNASRGNVAYTVTVTLTKKEWTPSANSPKRYTPRRQKNTSTSSGSGQSRAQAHPTPNFLDYRKTDGWMEPNKVWDAKLPVGDEGASFPTDQPMLARSQGYDIVVKIGDEPYTGHIGFYIDTWKNNDGIGNDDGYDHWDGDWSDNPQPALNNPTNTFFSQRSLNKYYNNDGKEWNLSYACRFKHPVSDREFMAFEDWEITHPGPDDYATDGTTTGREYSSSDYSSDRDFNDLLYLVQTYTAKPKNETLIRNTENRGFSWIWALEDLGSTDDFDFNDVVVRISSITTTVTQNNNGSDDTPTIVKKITFTPLAAGGTLPIYIHFKFDEDYDFILKPGTFDLSTAENVANTELSTEHGVEYHSWLIPGCGYQYMINTDSPTNGRSVAIGQDSQKCVLTVSSSYRLNNRVLPMGTDNNQYTMDAKDAQFYVTVKGEVAENVSQNIDQDRLNESSYAVAIPEKGAAPQSFLIVEQLYENTSTETEDSEAGNSSSSTNNNVPFARPWYWAKERHHILDAYPNFRDWVGHANNNTWYKNYVEEHVVIKN